MHGGPDAKQHGDDTCAKDIESAASVGAGLPVHYVSVVAKNERAHVQI